MTDLRVGQRIRLTAALELLSLGAGVQSTALALLAEEGVLPKPDGAIFADTGWEPASVYAHLDRLEAAVSFPIHRVTRGNLRADHLNVEAPFSSMPLFVRGQDGRDAMSRRVCTQNYKLDPVREKVRELLGYPKPARVPSKRIWANVWVGFSTDEVGRVSDRSPLYARLTHPLLDLGMSRKDCERYLRSRGWDVAKSACIGCPFHGNAAWRDLRDNHPAEWADAVEFDAAIRNGPKGTRSAMRGERFLHRSLLPLAEAPIDTVTRREWSDRQGDIYDLDEMGDVDGCSPFGCRSGGAA